MFTSAFSHVLSAAAAFASDGAISLPGAAPLLDEGVPQVYVIGSENGLSAHVAAGSARAGELVVLVLSNASDARAALEAGVVLDARELDATGSYEQPLNLPESERRAELGQLMAIVVDARGEPHASAQLALPAETAAAPLQIQITPGPVAGPIQPCLIVPPCTAGQAPDLVITNITLNTATTSAGCTGAALPFVGCPNGRSFTITATIANIGTCGVQCRTPIRVKWGKGSTAGGIVFEFFNQTVNTVGLPVGGTMSITRSYYMGPCDTQPWTFHLDFFSAIVDPTNTIAELNETNNTAAPVAACNFE